MYLWTSECVSAGHPDKVADQISDAILDAYLLRDPYSKVAVETLITENFVTVAGEVTSEASINKQEIEAIVRGTIADIGYTKEIGFDPWNCEFINKIHAQSPQINKAVKVIGDQVLGAGDQGIMFGYATNQTPTFMPLPIYLARNIVDYLATYKGNLLLPDAKTQVTVAFDENNNPLYVDTVVVSTQHRDENINVLKDYVRTHVLERMFLSLPQSLNCLFNGLTKYIINPAGVWTFGGPAADTGVTGRKIVVDNYGADCPIGGGAFSGKDPSKVDRSAAYAARYLAKNIVVAGHADTVRVQLSYAIGVTHPISIRVEPQIDLPEDLIYQFSPSTIIDKLKLRRPIYLKTAKFGHFGFDVSDNDFHYPWENTSNCSEFLKSKG